MSIMKMKKLANAKIVEAMELLQKAYKLADIEAADAEIKKCYASDALIRFEYIYPVYEGNIFFEADISTAQKNYDKACNKANLLHDELEQINNAIIALCNAINTME